MEKILISNLHNSIRFYNRLINHKPERLSFNSAYYNTPTIELELMESDGGFATSRGFMLVLPDENAFLDTFHRMTSFAHQNLNSTCQVAENYFDVRDPDGHIWILSKERLQNDQIIQIEQSGNCYLEPFNFKS